jgi:hypothetical protein
LLTVFAEHKRHTFCEKRVVLTSIFCERNGMNAPGISGRERALEKILWAIEVLKGTIDPEERAECCKWAARINTELENVTLARALAESAANAPAG